MDFRLPGRGVATKGSTICRKYHKGRRHILSVSDVIAFTGPTCVAHLECWSMIGPGSTGTMSSGAGRQWPKALCGFLVLSCFFHCLIRLLGFARKQAILAGGDRKPNASGPDLPPVHDTVHDQQDNARCCEPPAPVDNERGRVPASGETRLAEDRPRFRVEVSILPIPGFMMGRRFAANGAVVGAAAFCCRDPERRAEASPSGF